MYFYAIILYLCGIEQRTIIGGNIMAGNLGSLEFSLDIRSKIDKKLDQYGKKIDALNNYIGTLQNRIDHAAERLSKMAEGGEAWKNQREYVKGLYHDLNSLVGEVRVYERALSKVEVIRQRVAEGGLIGPARTFTTLLDTKPIESQINRLEQVQKLLQDLQNEQGKKMSSARHIESLQQQIAALGGEGMTLQSVKGQLDSLYSTLLRFDDANRRVSASTKEAVSDEQRRARAMKDARIAFEPLVAAQAREEAQQRANKANIDATNQARQRQVQVLREQARATMEARAAALQEQKMSLGRSYIQGRNMGLDPTELETILSRYREISQELLNLRTMMQHTSSMSYNGMFGAGRITGPGGGYAKEANEQVSQLRTRTLEAASAARQLATEFDRVHGAASRTNSVLSDIKSLFLQGGIVYGAQQFFNSVVKTGGDIVQQHIALRSILGDVQKADELFAQTQQLALQSPFTFQELNRDVKQLAAFGVDTDRLYDTTRRLADVASGLGVSFERLGLAYGQVKARSWLDGKELRQFAYAGLPMLQKIADLYNETGKNGRNNYTTSDIKTMVTKRQVSFEDVDKVFQRLTDKGGQFYNMQFVLSDTLLGRWNKLEDAWTIMLGKFADGENIFGKVFATAINGVTNLILQLDRLSPLLLSFGTAFAGKKIFGALTGAMGIGTGSILKQMSLVQSQQMRTYATAQLQKVAEGEITAELAQQNILKQRQLVTSTGVKDLAYAQIFAEGRINALQLAQLARRGEVSAALITQLRTMGLISAKQEQLILQAKEEGFVRSRTAMAQLGAGGVASKLGGFLTGGNLAMIGASVGMALWMGYSQWSNRIEQATKAAVDHAKQLAKQLQSEIANARSGGVSEETVKQMEDVVEQSGLYTVTMQEQVEQASTLQEKYDALLKVMQQMSEEATNMQRYSENAQSAIKATSVMSYKGYLNRAWSEANNWQPLEALSDVLGFGALADFMFNDDIDKNLEQYTSSRTQYDNSISQMQDYASQIHSVLDGIKGDYADTYNAIQGKSFEEQLRILSNSDAWDKIVDKIGENDQAFKGLADTYVDNTDDVDSKWSEIVNDDVPRLAADLAEQYHMNLNEFEEYCKKHPQFASTMIRQVVASLQQGSAATKNELLKVLLDFFGLADEYAAKIKEQKEPTEYDKETDVGKQLLHSLVARYGNGVVTVADINRVAGANDDYAKAKKNIQQMYNDANENYVAAKNAGVTGSRLNALKNERDKWYKLGSANGIELSSKSDKDAAKKQREADKEQNQAEQAARKADQDDEKRLRARLSLINDAYETYKKYYNLLHNEQAAAGIVSAQYKDKGLSNEDVSKITSEAGYRSLVSDYIAMARGMQYRRPDEMRERKDEDIANGISKLNDIDYQALARGMSEFSSTMTRDLNNMSRTWENYQTLLKATGNAGLSARISGLSKDSNGLDYSVYADGTHRNGYVSAYSDYLKNYINSLILSSKNPDKAVDFNALMGMSDKDVENYAGQLFGADDPTKIEGFVSAFKKLRDLVTDEEFRNAISVYADAMGKVMSESAITDRIDQDRDDRINQLTTLKDSGAITQDQFDWAKGVIDANANMQKLRATLGYINLINRSLAMGDDQFTTELATAEQRLGEQLKANAISADDYATELSKLKKIEKDREDNKVFGKNSAFTNFLKGGFAGMSDYYGQKMEERAAEVAKEGKDPEKDKQYKELEGRKNAIDSLMRGMNSLSIVTDAVIGVFNGLQQAANDLSEMFDALGNEHMANFFSDFSDVVGGVSSIFTPINNIAKSAMSGDVSGIVSSAISAPVSMITGPITAFAKLHDKKLERQIEQLARINTTLDNVRSSIERNLSNTLGSVYAYDSKVKDAQAIQEGIRQYQKDNGTWFARWINKALGRFVNQSRYKTETYNQMQQANKTGAAYDQELAAYMMQRDNLEAQLDKERDKKKSDKDKISDYQNQIDELNDTISTFAKDMAKSLYGIDVSSWAKSLSDTIVDAWASGEDAAEKYHDKVKELMKDLAKNIIAKKYMEIALQPVETLIENLMKENSGILSEDNINEIADKILSIGDTSVSTITSLLDKLKAGGLDFTDTNSASMSSSIKGLTETTGDILASYANAMRADLSVVRQQITIGMPQLNMTATAQLQQQVQIAQNTLRNADAAESINRAVGEVLSILNAVTHDSKQIFTRVH